MTQGTVIRRATEADHAFIVHSWLKSAWPNHDRRCGSNHTFYAVHGPIVRRLVWTSQACLVACDPDDPKLIQAWLVGDERDDGVPVIHYAYTKDLFRRMGLFSRLAATFLDGKTGPVACSHRGRHSRELERRLATEGIEAFHDPHAACADRERKDSKQ